MQIKAEYFFQEYLKFEGCSREFYESELDAYFREPVPTAKEKMHRDIAIIHYSLEKINGEVEALKEKAKHAKSKFKATDSDGGSITIGSYGSSYEDYAPQQKEDVEVKKTLRELLEPARMRQLEVQRRRTLHLSNLSYDVTEEDIMNFFSGIGGSMDVRIPLGQDGKCRGFAFVEFDHPRSAEEGLKLHLKPMLKRSVRISIAHPRVAGVGRGAPGVGRGRGAR
ncbi:hypothetical protein Bca101_004277 [Brassica carinata]